VNSSSSTAESTVFDAQNPSPTCRIRDGSSAGWDTASRFYAVEITIASTQDRVCHQHRRGARVRSYERLRDLLECGELCLTHWDCPAAPRCHSSAGWSLRAEVFSDRGRPRSVDR
jgi:hypothetical protein